MRSDLPPDLITGGTRGADTTPLSWYSWDHCPLDRLGDGLFCKCGPTWRELKYVAWYSEGLMLFRVCRTCSTTPTPTIPPFRDSPSLPLLLVAPVVKVVPPFVTPRTLVLSSSASLPTIVYRPHLSAATA